MISHSEENHLLFRHFLPISMKQIFPQTQGGTAHCVGLS